MIPCVCLKGARVFGAMKGAADGGLDIPHRLIELCYGQHLNLNRVEPDTKSWILLAYCILHCYRMN